MASRQGRLMIPGRMPERDKRIFENRGQYVEHGYAGSCVSSCKITLQKGATRMANVISECLFNHRNTKRQGLKGRINSKGLGPGFDTTARVEGQSHAADCSRVHSETHGWYTGSAIPVKMFSALKQQRRETMNHWAS